MAVVERCIGRERISWKSSWVEGKGFKWNYVGTFFHDCLAVDFLALVFGCEDLDIDPFFSGGSFLLAILMAERGWFRSTTFKPITLTDFAAQMG